MNRTERSTLTAGRAPLTATTRPLPPMDAITTYLAAVGMRCTARPQHLLIEYRYCSVLGGDRYGETVLSNHHTIAVSQLKALINVLCYDGLYFDAVQCGLPCLAAHLDESDPDWHEILRMSPTDKPCTVKLDVADFLTNALKQQRPATFPNRAAAEHLFIS